MVLIDDKDIIVKVQKTVKHHSTACVTTLKEATHGCISGLKLTTDATKKISKGYMCGFKDNFRVKAIDSAHADVCNNCIMQAL